MDARSIRWCHAALLAASLGTVVACATPPLDGTNSDLPFPVRDDDAGATPDPAGPTPGDAVKAPSCMDSCPKDGAQRCSGSSASGVEICSASSDGCLAWKQDVDCPADFSCDTAKNDGSCKAGCTNDAGCDAGTAGTARCVLPNGPNGTAEETCSVVGACYQWKTTRSNVPQECVSSGNYCSSDVRKNCVASAAGACTQHVSQAKACAQGLACQGAGQCVQASLCGAGLSCASVATTGASPCNQVLPPSAPYIYCCPAGQTIVGGACK